MPPLSTQRDFESLAGTAYTARVLEATARFAVLQGRWQEAKETWSKAGASWAQLGAVVRAQLCSDAASRALPSRAVGIEGDPLITIDAHRSTGEVSERSGSNRSTFTEATAHTASSPPPTGLIPDPFPRLRVERTSIGLRQGQVLSGKSLPTPLMVLLRERAQKGQYQRALKLWDSPRYNVLPTVDVALAGLGLPTSGDCALELPRLTGANLVPWEIAATSTSQRFYRTNENLQQTTNRVVQWIQRTLNFWSGNQERVYVDGRAGVQTLRSLQALGITTDVPLAQVVLEMRERARKQVTKPSRSICLVRAVREEESRAGILREEADHYTRQGLESASFSGMDTGAIAAYCRRVKPVLIHLHGKIFDSSDASKVMIGDGKQRIRVDHVVDWIQHAKYDAGAWPVVVLEVPLQFLPIREERRAILQRNHFCGRLWESGVTAAVIGTCFDLKAQMGRAAAMTSNDRWLELPTLAAQLATVTEAASAWRDPKWGDLARATAVWKLHPHWPLYWPF